MLLVSVFVLCRPFVSFFIERIPPLGCVPYPSRDGFAHAQSIVEVGVGGGGGVEGEGRSGDGALGAWGQSSSEEHKAWVVGKDVCCMARGSVWWELLNLILMVMVVKWNGVDVDDGREVGGLRDGFQCT